MMSGKIKISTHNSLSAKEAFNEFVIAQSDIRVFETFVNWSREQGHTDLTELAPELLRLFIEKIVVYEKDIEWSKHAPQAVEISYNGIGYVGSGQQNVTAPPHPQDAEKPRQAS